MAAEHRDAYPTNPDEFEILSKPIFTLSRDGRSELLVFDARMVVNTAQPQTNRRGKRQVNLEITEWVAQAHSTLLDQDIVMRQEGDDHPQSRVTAQNFDSDFPGEMRFPMNWAIEIGQERIAGLQAEAVGTINAFPPAPGDVFDIVGKDLEVGGTRLVAVACAHAA